MQVTVQAAQAAARNLLAQNIHEVPAHSNRTPVGEWFGMNGVAWCAETISRILFDAGFNDGHGAILIPGVHTTYKRGWSYVPAIVGDASNAHLFDRKARPGDIACCYWAGDSNPGDSHTFFVDDVKGTQLISIEGNSNDRLERRTDRRSDASYIKGFFHPPYVSAVTPTPPPPPIVVPSTTFIYAVLEDA